jgi:O-antigen ligase
VKWRISETAAKKYSGPQDNNNGLSIRALMWQTAWSLVKERPLLGYGVKGARVKVIERYREENFMLGYNEGYHSHNQYLQSALMGGIPAFLLLLAMLLKMGWEGFRKNNILLLLLLFHFVCQSVIESTFEVQQELVFYMLFLFLFYYHPPTDNDSHALF